MKTIKASIFICTLYFTVFPVTASANEVSAAGGCSVPNSHPDAWGFYERVKSFPGWTGNFYKEDTNSKEIQYKRHDMGGQNNSWVDSSDIHYHVSHGGSRYDSYYGKNLTAILFEDGTNLVPSEARVAWGDTDLEWIAFRNCTLLNDTSKVYWSNAMNGLHLLLGFKTNSSKHDSFGRIWADNMRQTTILWWTFPGQTITQAWFNATDATQPSGTTARVLAEVYNNYNDHLWGNGYTSSDPTVDNVYYWWDHVAGSPPYLRVNNLKSMYAYQVVPRTIDEQYIRQIGSAFGLTGEVSDLCDAFVMADVSDPANPKILEISKTTGHYQFRNDGKLFVADPKVGRYPPQQAIEVAQSFLSRNKMLPTDARAYSVEFDTITEQDRNKGTIGQVLYQNTNVVWARQIPAIAEGTLVSVAGAGARLKIYIAEDGGVMGGLGNWRNIEPTGQVAVNDSKTAWSFFDRYGEKVAVEPVQVEYDNAIPNFETATQLYYEFSSQISQTELIPCWLFDVDYYFKGSLVLTANTFVPANVRYMPPVVEITKPADSETFNVGDTIGFTCSIVPGFGTEPYSFLWESSVDGVLSTQQSFDTSSLTVNCPDVSLDCSPLPHVISVKVTDARGIQSSDTIQIVINGPCDECKDPADLNKDNIVDLADFAELASRFLMESGHGE